MSRSVLQSRPHLIPSMVAAVMLLAVLSPWPEFYYRLLRWVVCCIGIFVAYLSCKWGEVWVAVLFGLVAILFNPVVPIQFSRQVWPSIGKFCSIIFVVASFVLERREG